VSYSDFKSLEELETAFGIRSAQTSSLLCRFDTEVSDWLKETMRRHIPLATAINTEKARSELAPVLVELKELIPTISVFSGREFNVDPRRGLNGYCDFLISQSPDQLTIKAPVAAIVEAKREDLNEAIPQCVAAMIAAQIVNRAEFDVYGVITTGSVWRFLRLRSYELLVDLNEVYLMPLETLLGSMIATLHFGSIH
jgi:hypothetical protein